MPIHKVLVVDDSKTELLFLTDLLQKNGFSVKTAENADDAMRRLEEERPDLILMDVVMPGQNGFQLTRAIARNPQYANVPIILCTRRTRRPTASGACAKVLATTSSSRSTPPS